MNKISDKIYLGNSKDAANDFDLAQAGITAVLNVAIDLPCPVRKGIVSYRVGLYDGPGNPAGMFEAAVVTLGSLIEGDHTVLIHCHAGISRSPAVLAAYLTAKKGYGRIEPQVNELAKIRGCVDPDNELLKLAQAYVNKVVYRI